MAVSQVTARRERLLALDPLPPQVRSRCEAAIQELLVRKLSPLQRLWGWISVLVNLFIACGLLTRLAGYGEPLDYPIELVVVTTILLLGLTAWLAYVLVRRSIHVLRDQVWVDAIGCIGMLVMGAVFLQLTWQGDDLAGSLKLAGLIVLLFGGGTAWAAFLSLRRRRLIQIKVKSLEQELRCCRRAGRS
jgi:voltage-gated potassium channel Kch